MTISISATPSTRRGQIQTYAERCARPLTGMLHALKAMRKVADFSVRMTGDHSHRGEDRRPFNEIVRANHGLAQTAEAASVKSSVREGKRPGQRVKFGLAAAHGPTWKRLGQYP